MLGVPIILPVLLRTACGDGRFWRNTLVSASIGVLTLAVFIWWSALAPAILPPQDDIRHAAAIVQLGFLAIIVGSTCLTWLALRRLSPRE